MLAQGQDFTVLVLDQFIAERCACSVVLPFLRTLFRCALHATARVPTRLVRMCDLAARRVDAVVGVQLHVARRGLDRPPELLGDFDKVLQVTRFACDPVEVIRDQTVVLAAA